MLWFKTASCPFAFQTKGKLQIGTGADVEKYLSTAQIQDCGNADLQKLKVMSQCEWKQSICAVCYANHGVGSVPKKTRHDQQRDPDF